jgi:hypothetical protein
MICYGFLQSDATRWLGGYLVACDPGDGYRWSAIKKALARSIRQM